MPKISEKNLNIFLSHPDRDEIISKLTLDIPTKDIHEWLEAKYSSVNEKKYILSEANLSSFKKDHLNVYNIIQSDLSKSRTAIATANEEQLELSVKNLPAYKNLLLKSANEELDIRQTIKNLCVAIETRFAQVFDEIQEDPRNINTRIDRLLIDYTEVLGNILDKYYKFTEAPTTNVVQSTITLQVVDKHIGVFHEVMRDVLSQMDVETSLYFMEVFNEKMNKLKSPADINGTTSEVRLAEVKLLNETINEKINQ